MGGSGSATSLKERINDAFFSHLPTPRSLDPDNTDDVYVRLLSRNADRGDAARRVLMRDAGAIGRDMLGEERALPPRRTGIILDIDDIMFVVRFAVVVYSSLMVLSFIGLRLLLFSWLLPSRLL